MKTIHEDCDQVAIVTALAFTGSYVPLHTIMLVIPGDLPVSGGRQSWWLQSAARADLRGRVSLKQLHCQLARVSHATLVAIYTGISWKPFYPVSVPRRYPIRPGYMQVRRYLLCCYFRDPDKPTTDGLYRRWNEHRTCTIELPTNASNAGRYSNRARTVARGTVALSMWLATIRPDRDI